MHCGPEDRHEKLEDAVKYAVRVAGALGLPVGSVQPLMVVHGSLVDGGSLAVRVPGRPGPVYVVGADRLLSTLVAAPKAVDPRRAAAVAARVDQVLRPYA